MSKPFVLGIAGGSGAGKSTLSAGIMEYLPASQTVLLPHDAYFRGAPGDINPAAINYDHPDALDTALCAEHLRRLRNREPVRIPVYDFARHSRSAGTIALAPAPVIIVEGILVLYESALRTQMDIRVYVDADVSVRYARRLQRDMKERDRSEASVRMQWEKSVMPMHRQYVEPSKEYANAIVDGNDIVEHDIRDLAELVLRAARLH